MTKFMTYIIRTLSVLAIATLLGSCSDYIDKYGNPECDYTVQIRYDYNRENTSDTNLLDTYIQSMEEYIFDGDGILYAVNPVTVDVCDGTWHSDLDLPPGRYSLITVGNRTSMSEISDNGTTPQIGTTRREDMLLTLENESQTNSGRGWFENCGRLFHTYRTFSVEPYQASFVRADMVHSHCVIRFTIRWRGTPPANAYQYYIRMLNVPSEYNLMPEFIYPQPGAVCEYHTNQSDHYEASSNAVIHHIPTVHNDRNIVTHRREVNRTMNDIQGETVTYRLREAGQTMFGLFTENGTRVMKDIHINDFLNRMEVDLDHTLRQEYEIIFEIDDQNGTVHVFFPQVGDWDEGGSWIY